MNIPRPEHPKPQFERENWLNLNGIWQFEIDNGKSGIQREHKEKNAKLKDEIVKNETESGASREEVLAVYTGDEAFDEWFEIFKEKIETIWIGD